MMFLKKIILKLIHKYKFTSLLFAFNFLIKKRGYLYETGWVDSLTKHLPADKKGQPLPWYSYSAIAFLDQRVNTTMSVFEYGCGNSTLWWSKRASDVVSCEHDLLWSSIMKAKLPSNVELLHINLSSGDKYSKAILKLYNTFDIIILDGRDRVNCAKNSITALKPDGIIIWDNSDRTEYQEGYDFLFRKKFKRLDFYGLGPINTYGWCTTIFYRKKNCLNI